MSNAPSHLFRLAWTSFARNWSSLIAFEAAFKLLEAWLLAPALALLFSVTLAFTGNVALANRQIIDFAQSPLGMVCIGFFGVLAVALLLAEQAALMQIVSPLTAPRNLPLASRLSQLLGAVRRITQLGCYQAGLIVLALAPFAAVAFITYVALLTEYDIYFYWKSRPREFWVAIGTGKVLLLLAAGVATYLIVRWSLALPILLFERQTARQALRTSAARTRGNRYAIGKVLIGWQLFVFLLGIIGSAGLRWLAANSLGGQAVSNLTVIVLLLLHALLLACWSLASSMGHALLTRELYLRYGAQPLAPPSRETETAMPKTLPNHWQRWGTALAIMLVILPPLAAWAGLWQHALDIPEVGVTAHRGHARRAPENTLAALQKAIDSGADFAEIDVQLTADGAVVLFHDRELRRTTGDSRRVGEVTLADLRKLEAGSWFDPKFAGEPIPTLSEAMALVRGKCKLNIELKYYGFDPQLAPAVAALLRDEHFEQECIVTSFEMEGLQQVRAACPQVRVGLIIAQSLGAVSRLDVQLLSVRADHITDTMLRRAHLHEQEVHAWTVNDAQQMLSLMDRGVDNLITSDPDLAIATRRQWQEKPPTERALSSLRAMLGLPR